MDAEYRLFYRSEEWLTMRKKALKVYGKSCMCCGSQKSLQVDHIFPRSRFIHLELDFYNLQILCKPCNIDKSNVDYTDYRSDDQKRLAKSISGRINPVKKAKDRPSKRKRNADHIMREIMAFGTDAVAMKSGRYRICGKIDVCTFTNRIIYLNGKRGENYRVGTLMSIVKGLS